jgi:hypothetical protein
MLTAGVLKRLLVTLSNTCVKDAGVTQRGAALLRALLRQQDGTLCELVAAALTLPELLEDAAALRFGCRVFAAHFTPADVTLPGSLCTMMACAHGALLRCTECVVVVEVAMLALKSLGGARDGAGAVLAAGCLPTVLLAMAHHAAAVHVQTAGCDLLWGVLLSCPAAVHEVAALGGVCVVMRALRRFRDAPRLQVVGIGVLHTLAVRRNTYEDVVVATGGFGVAAAALHDHETNTGVLLNACALLYVLGHRFAGTPAALQVMPAVMHVRESGPPNAPLQLAAAATLLEFVHGCAHNRSVFMSMGGAQALEAAMRAHPHNAAVQQVCCAVVVALSLVVVDGEAACASLWALYRGADARWLLLLAASVYDAHARFGSCASVQIAALMALCVLRGPQLSQRAMQRCALLLQRHHDDATLHGVCSVLFAAQRTTPASAVLAFAPAALMTAWNPAVDLHV